MGYPYDDSRTRVETRVAFPTLDADEDAEEIASHARRFSLREITSGLPDDCREEERRVRELRARVKGARALVSNAPGLAQALQKEWRRAARFHRTQSRTTVPAHVFCALLRFDRRNL